MDHHCGLIFIANNKVLLCGGRSFETIKFVGHKKNEEEPFAAALRRASEILGMDFTGINKYLLKLENMEKFFLNAEEINEHVVDKAWKEEEPCVTKPGFVKRRTTTFVISVADENYILDHSEFDTAKFAYASWIILDTAKCLLANHNTAQSDCVIEIQKFIETHENIPICFP
jgi:hypothetical protein